MQQWFNTAAFARPDAFTYGNAGRNIVIGPGMFNTDMSLIRNFTLGGLQIAAVPARSVQRVQQPDLGRSDHDDVESAVRDDQHHENADARIADRREVRVLTREALPRLAEQLAAVDDGGLRRSVAADRDPGVLVERAVVVRAALRMPHEVARLQRDGLPGPEHLALVRVPRASEHDDVALVGVIVRAAHHARREMVDRQVVARLRRIAFDDRGLTPSVLPSVGRHVSSSNLTRTNGRSGNPGGSVTVPDGAFVRSGRCGSRRSVSRRRHRSIRTPQPIATAPDTQPAAYEDRHASHQSASNMWA